MVRLALAFTLVAAFAAAGCVAPGPASDASCPGDEALRGVGEGRGGGVVEDAPPRILAFAGSLAEADDSGRFTESFGALLFDANGERDLVGALVRLVVDGPAPEARARTITRAAANETREPPSVAADGFKVWTGERGDGHLLVVAERPFSRATVPGNYSFVLEVTPPGGATLRSLPDATIVRAYSLDRAPPRESPAFAAPLASGC